MITTLTKKQEAQIPVFIKKYVDLASQPTDRAKATKAVQALYKSAGYKKPIVIFGQSPLSTAIMVAMTRILTKNKLPKDGSQLYSQLYNVVGYNWWIIVWWLVWAGWYAFGEYIGVKFDNKVFKIFMNFVTNVSFIIPYEGIAFVSETPQISWNEGKLHNIENKAVKYADGYGLYNLYGVNFDEKLFKKVTAKRVQLKTILTIENMEQRMAGLKLVGVEKLFKTKNAKRLDKSKRGNELYLIKGIFSQDAYYLKYTCPSTGRVYASGIDPEIGRKKDADLAMGWKFQLSKEDYLKLEVES